MRWVTKTKPNAGDERYRVRFAWIPTKLDGHITVWLERYISTEIYLQSKWMKLNNREYDL